MSTDFPLIQHRTIARVEPLTGEGRGWVEDHVKADVTGFGPALGVAPRGSADMLPGVSIAGLGVARG